MIKSDYIRIYKSVHTWTGILSGMALFIAFYAGALTVFKDPIVAWASPPAQSQRIALEQAPTLIARTLEKHPSVAAEFTLRLEQAPNLTSQLQWQVRDPQADDHDDTGSRHYVASLDAQGSAVVEKITPSTLGGLIDTLHRVVGLPFDTDPNRWFMGVVSALYAIALFSGVVVLLPSLVKDFFALRIGHNLKRMWLDAHNVVGIVSLPFHIIMAVTAVVFAFHDQIYDAQDKLVHGGKWATAFQRPKQPQQAVMTRDPAQMRTPAELLAIARQTAPDFVPYQLQYQHVTAPRAVVRIWGKDDGAVQPRARGGFMAVDPYSGKVINTDYLPGQQSGANLIISSIFALHMAAFGGSLVQWMYFLLGLAGAWLFYSGNLLWIESRRRRAAKGSDQLPVQRMDTRLMAAATVGVCLGCVCGISLSMLGAKWLYGRVEELGAWLLGLYYAMFFVALAWAFITGAARAGVHLCWAAAALTAALPLTSLLGMVLPALGLWHHDSSAQWGVDLTACLMAGSFALMGCAAARRSRSAPTDSVWNART